MRRALRPLAFLALLSCPATLATAQPALLPLSPASSAQVRPLLDAEATALLAGGHGGAPLLALATSYAMIGDVERAAELGKRVEAAHATVLRDNPLAAALDFQGASPAALSHRLPTVRAALASAEQQAAKTGEGTPERERALRAVDDARAELGYHETAIQASSLFIAGKLQEAFAHAGLLPESGVVSRQNVRNGFLRALVQRGNGDLAVSLLDGMDPTQADKYRWLIAQHFAFRREFSQAADVAGRILDDDLWRGAKLGIALAYARFGATDKARAEVDLVIANRHRPLPAGALANPPTLHNDPLRPPDPRSDRSSPINYFLLGAGRDRPRVQVPMSLVALNLLDEGDPEGARRVVRALAQSVGSDLAGDQSVSFLASIARRQLDLGDSEGAMRSLGLLDGVAWLVSGSSDDPQRWAYHRSEGRRLYAELTSEIRGMEAAFAKFRSSGQHDTYCAILTGAINRGDPLETIMSVARQHVPNMRPQGCDTQLLMALARRGRYEDAADKLAQVDFAISAGVAGVIIQRLAVEPPSPAVVRLREALLDRCLRTLECGQPSHRQSWDDLLLLFVRHGEPLERLDAVVVRLLEIGHDLSLLARNPNLRVIAGRVGPQQVDAFMQAVGRAMTEPDRLRLRAEARAHAGDLEGALELVRQIQHPDVRVDSLVAVTAVAWRRENSGALEVLSAHSAKRRNDD